VWLVRSLLVFVVVASVLALAVVNVEHHTSLTLFTRTYQNLALNVVLFCAMLCGAILVFGLMVFREFALRNEIRRLRRENLRLDDEITALRNLPLAGLDTARETQGSRPAER
jgi:uncharacterized integral membrane protein